MDVLEEAKKILLKQPDGVLSTHSSDVPGYPFGSLVPVCLDRYMRPILLISRLAQHTKNILVEPRVSLFLSNVAAVGYKDVQTCSRLTLLAKAEQTDDQDAIARYCRYYPDAAHYHQNLDFDFYRLAPVKVRFIGGFGSIHWLSKSKLFTPNPFDEAQEKDIIEHMNDDHAETLRVYCKKANLAIPQGLTAEMVGVDADGFHIRIGQKIAHFEFPHSVTTPMEVRDALIKLLHN